VAALAPRQLVSPLVTGSALLLLAILGALAARVGGASLGRGAIRVIFWGALAMAASALVGMLFGATV